MCIRDRASYRYGHGQAVLDGTAFVLGGWDYPDFHNDLLTLKLGDAAAQWAAVAAQGDVPAGRWGGALAAVGQQLLLYSGDSYSGGYIYIYHSDLALLDPRNGSWTAVTGASGTTPAGWKALEAQRSSGAPSSITAATRLPTPTPQAS